MWSSMSTDRLSSLALLHAYKEMHIDSRERVISDFLTKTSQDDLHFIDWWLIINTEKLKHSFKSTGIAILFRSSHMALC